ncbi:MAG: hypothetical protein MUF74_10980 [Cypionkella sp.]|jgi:hypothetical protein|nr:hypothetical protein [Cypionkella sp.]
MKATLPCQRCSRIRAFLFLAAPLIALMAFLPEAGVPLAGKLPPPIVFGMMIPMVGLPVFVVRLVRWHRAGRP